MTESKPSVAAIVLNWNNYEDTVEVVAGLDAIGYENLTVIVVDNGSTDNSTNRLENEFPEVEFIYNRENLGFPGGNNIGIREALDRGFDYLWLLNNDIVIPDDFDLESLLLTVESYSLIDSVSPLLTEYPDKDQMVQTRIRGSM
jgi:GT2 family glycosyltransferase